MAIKEINFEGFNHNVKTKRRVKHHEIGKELLRFVLERESDGFFEDLVLEKADRLRVSHYIGDHDLNLSKVWLQSFKSGTTSKAAR